MRGSGSLRRAAHLRPRHFPGLFGGPWPHRKPHRFWWIDILLLAALAGGIVAAAEVAGRWQGALRPEVVIDLSPWALPKYALLSLARGLLAYGLSLAFTLGYGYWAAHDRRAERVLIPLLDILQSLPVLAFMPGFVLGLVHLFPGSNAGLELAAVLMIFTGQAWNMTFSFYHSIRSIPREQLEAATVFRFGAWQRLRQVELPFATLGLVWNSMMSMAGGWFFLMVSEAFVLRDKDFRLPGLGSYMSVAVARGDVPAMLWAIAAMVLLIVLLDQFLWRPAVVWAQKFRTEEGAAAETSHSWFLDLLRRSRLLRWLRRAGSAGRRGRAAPGREAAVVTNDPTLGGAPPATAPDTSTAPTVPAVPPPPPAPRPRAAWLGAALSWLLLALLLAGLGAALLKLGGLLGRLPGGGWPALVAEGGLTLLRVLAAVTLGTLWALPAGIAIGLSPRWSRRLQPVIQVVASFPAPMLFPLVVAGLAAGGISLGWGSVLLMLLGTQWYILFNVIAGTMAIPSELKEAAVSYRLGRARRFWQLEVPAVFPYLVTGWVTAAGGAWNASIVSEWVTFRGRVLEARGLGAWISRTAAAGDFPALAAGVVVMSTLVVLFNRLVWRRVYHLAETRYSLSP